MIARLGPGEAIACPTIDPAGLFFRAPSRPGEAVTVATSPGELIGDGGNRWRLAHRWLRDWLRGCADPAGTPYVGMERLLPGQELSVDSAGQVAVRDLVGPNVWPEPYLQGEDALQTFIETFDAAVAELLDGSRTVTCELSGGLDSSFVAASLARQAPDGVTVHAFTHIPHPEATVNAGAWVASDEESAGSLAHAYPDTLAWHPLANTSGRTPLEMTRIITARAWWPAFGPGNLEWIDTIRTRAAHLGSPAVWSGTHGNAAFSHYHNYANTPTPTSLRRRAATVVRSVNRRARKPPAATQLKNLLREPPITPEPETRASYLNWLAGHRAPHSGLLNPDAFEVPSIDPYRHPAVLDIAARITPESWSRPGQSRGFARAAGLGRVTDEIRLRTARGAQGVDAWHWMSHDQATYSAHIDQLNDTPAIADLVDTDAIRIIVDDWPWGSRTPPARVDISRINRILGFAQYIRDTEARLAGGSHLR